MVDQNQNQSDMERGRTEEFKRSTRLETLLAEVNGILPETLAPPYQTPRYPVILVMGVPRSGTTLMTQWLASTGLFAYPTNMSARFYANPYFGARIQQILADEDASNQIGLKDQSPAFSSALGKTEGALAPSEFWYFWRQFFQFGEIQTMTEAAEQAADGVGFLRGLAGLEAAFDKPVMLKGMFMNWHIAYLDALLGNVLFINVERDSFYNAQSLYYARKRFFGTADRWYSFKPPEYAQLADADVETQLAGQVFYTKQAIRHGLRTVAPDRQVTISYEAFCRDPKETFEAIIKKLSSLGWTSSVPYAGASSFDVTNEVRLDQSQADALKAAIQTLEARHQEAPSS